MVMQRYVDQLPASRIAGKLADVGAMRHLLDDTDWHTPPTKVNNLARRLFRMANTRMEGIKDFAVSQDDSEVVLV